MIVMITVDAGIEISLLEGFSRGGIWFQPGVASVCLRIYNEYEV